ncbi:MAG: hypothetical protein KF774_17960 [Planctomyces sp.]|nr:hypothetical protein [Planctomyces sp.]
MSCFCGVDHCWLWGHAPSEASGPAVAEYELRTSRRDVYAHVALNYLTSNPRGRDGGPGAGVLIRRYGAIPTPPNEQITENLDFNLSGLFVWGCTFITFQLVVTGPAEAYAAGNIIYMSNPRPFFERPEPCCVEGRKARSAVPVSILPARKLAVAAYQKRTGDVVGTRIIQFESDASAPDHEREFEDFTDELARLGHDATMLRPVLFDPRKLAGGVRLKADPSTGKPKYVSSGGNESLKRSSRAARKSAAE